MFKKIDWISLFGVLSFSLLILFFYFKLSATGFLTFSDAAKSADIARNVISGLGYNGKFSFWSSSVLVLHETPVFPSPWLPPLMPFSIILMFKIFGISDLSVMATSSIYYLLLVVFVFLLGRKLFGNLVGALSAITVSASNDFINYATNGSTEAMFTFEIVATAYFLTLKKKWATIIAIIFAILMYFTRPQAFIYIVGLLLYWLLITFKTKKAVIIFVLSLVFGLLIDYFVLPIFAGKYFLYSVTSRGVGTATQVLAGGSASDSLRGGVVPTAGLFPVAKKLFYNIYNYYKLLPQILSPYLAALFALGLFRWGKNRTENSFKISVIFMVFTTFFVSALSIPFFRYIHPVVPLIYLVAVETLVWVISQISRRNAFLIISSSISVFVFIVGQSLGIIFLDSRFVADTHNVGKPPVYVTLSKVMKENTEPTDFIVTNLDTWGSWYGERRTIWYPVDPKQLFDPESGDIPFDAIYLTSYLINDKDYYMTNSWRQIFDNPNEPRKWDCDGCREIAKEFKVKIVYTIPSNDNYERMDTKAVLLVRK